MKSICVYCASSNAALPAYQALSDQVGQAIAQRGWQLVYGGGSTGVMGAVARAVHQHGGRVVGVIPEMMMNIELAYREADELIVTQTMRERKAIMDERSDAFLTLPGGFGTLEELFEILTHRQLGYHANPVAILNHQGFYDPLINLFEHLYEKRLAREIYRDTYHIAVTVDEALSYIEQQWTASATGATTAQRG